MRPLLRLFIALLLGAGVSSSSVAASHATSTKRDPTPFAIDYHVTRLAATDGDGYRITLRFTGSRSGHTPLHVPASWADATHAERGISGLEVTTPGARIEDTDRPEVKRIVHRPGEELTVSYVLRQIGAEPPNFADHPGQFLPVIQHDYFEWVGWTTWVVPVDGNDARVRVRIAFEGLPADWAFASSFGLDSHAVTYDGPVGPFLAALFVGGDFRLRSRPVLGGHVVTAVRGDWSFGDNAFADRVQRIVDAERSFWRDATQPTFLVVLMPLQAPPHFETSGGTGLTATFLTYVTPGLALPALDFLWTHEYFHQWNNAALGRFPEPQPQLYWFSEGFTDFYSNLLQLRLGLLTLEGYAAEYDEAIRFLAESRDGDAPNSEVAKRFFTDADTFGRLPYRRGMLLAAQWDAEIRTASHGARSLDDAMRRLHDQHLRGVDVLDAPRIVAVMQSFGVRDATGDIDRQIERGMLPRLADDVLGPCIALVDRSAPRVDPGFDVTGSTKGGPIVGVDVAGPAYAAGLRDGQQLRSLRSIDRVEHLVEAGFEEPPDHTIRTIRYRALGRDLTRQHVQVRDDLDAAARGRCLRAFEAS